MIAHHQPTCFPADLLAAVSSKNDGTMLDRTRGRHAADVVDNRQVFCRRAGVRYQDVVYQVHIIKRRRLMSSPRSMKLIQLSIITKEFLLMHSTLRRLASAYFYRWQIASRQ